MTLSWSRYIWENQIFIAEQSFYISHVINQAHFTCVVPENIHTHPIGDQWKFRRGGSQQPEFVRESMKLNWKFQEGEGLKWRKPSMGEVWIFSGATQYTLIIPALCLFCVDLTALGLYCQNKWPKFSQYRMCIVYKICVLLGPRVLKLPNKHFSSDKPEILGYDSKTSTCIFCQDTTLQNMKIV